MHFFPGPTINQKGKCFSMHIRQPLVSFLPFHPVLTMPQANLGYLQHTGQFISIYLLKTHSVPSTVNRKRAISLYENMSRWKLLTGNILI